MRHTFLLLFSCFTLACQGQITDPKATEFYEPVPPKVKPGSQLGEAPADAIILLGEGADASEWVSVKDGGPAKWTSEGNALVVNPGTGDIATRRKFGDMQLHVEWKSPAEPDKQGQQRGNSGIFLQNRYEVQVLESEGSDTYTNGQAGSIYKQTPPLVNALKPQGEWQSYDIIYNAPHFNKDGMLTRPAYVTVLMNGVVVQNHFEIKGPTEYIGLPHYVAHGDDVIKLQDHSNKVAYRNIWVREL
ncbi:hypothetical protein GGR26_000940 [Lewinella marina]|uniref:3-keto-alpha-glucoside-1,2-lyase/3-keto-2-hydroxy-glucal hydratase domain-containing protein n=1 Tax=Neolewinella marina TaxID=438751 RepID=A0A2G0CI63_9BACT|nr:DUF1080 domain-containing protein [Neolewinella marina]NJB85195.1 hypothetical protein [Neolewinella marina]PHK99672.1 hypothetical protein CGL56_01080 [Neolewinella marina]